MRVPGGAGTRIVTFISDIWSGAPTRLQQGAAAQYQKLARSGDFGPWWLNACGGEQPGVRRFRVQMPSTEWERPWEAIVAALDPSRWGDVSIIRQIEGDEAPRHPSSLSEALSVLVLQGAPSGPNLDMLDLDAEFQLIAKAYQERDFTVQQAVSAPIPERTSFAELDSLLLKHRPSVLWFSGHARPSPPGLLLNDGHWLTPDELAGSIQRTTVQHGRTPIYAVLWACNTGSAARFAVSMAAPPFIDVLFDQGISALLAAQAPLSEAAARRVAAHVFAALASGHPLDHGVARARGDLMRVSGARLLEDIDWVCPVVWSKGSPPPTLSWVDGREQKAQNQGTAWKVLPASLSDLPLEVAPKEQIVPWPDVPRLWIKSSIPGASDSRLHWAKRVLARQKQTDKTVLWFDFSSTLSEPKPAYLAVRQWAETIGRKVEHDDDRNRLIRNAAQEIAADHEKGWKSLCSRAEFIIAMIEPPEREPEWLWTGLRDGSNAWAIVLAKDYPEDRAQETWKVDVVMEEAATVDPTEAKTLGGLAVLSHPAARSDIQTELKQDLREWIERGIVVEVSSGCVMPAGVAEKVVSCLAPEAQKEAHQLAYKFLDGLVAVRKMKERPREDILLARWRHAQASQWTEAIRVDGVNLLNLYASENRSAAFLGILGNVVSEQRYLPEDIKIDAAWAHLNMGNADAARSWLNLLDPDDLEALQASRWYATAAEVEKSSGQRGSKQSARPYLERALSVLEGEELEDAVRQRLRIRQDIARLVHFFEKEPQTAVPLYEQVAAEWDAVPFAELDQAITRRNLAEALMDCSRFAEAEGQIGEARRLIPNWTKHPVVSELEYLDGRLAIRLGLGEAETFRRFENCREMALATNNMMMVAIVESRLFWRADPGQDSAGLFDDVGWDVCAQRLSVFERHAWAARVQVDGRLRAARRLGKRGERAKALKELADAKRLIERNPDLDQGSDQRRIVTLFAGLTLYDDSASWDQLKKERWAQDWLAKYDEPKKAWELAG